MDPLTFSEPTHIVNLVEFSDRNSAKMKIQPCSIINSNADNNDDEPKCRIQLMVFQLGNRNIKCLCHSQIHSNNRAHCYFIYARTIFGT